MTECTIKLSEVIKNQAIINIGCTGHVANGKSTIVKNFTGISTQKFKSEKERNITINIGYAGCKIWYSDDTKQIKYSHTKNKKMFDDNQKEMKLIHHFSFVDCPGHESFMNNMITGSSVMDLAFLIEDASAEIPQPQTEEHLIALIHSKIDDILIIQNKCDLLNKRLLKDSKDKLINFVNKHIPDNDITVIPCIAQKSINLDFIAKYLVNNINQYKKNLNDKFMLNIIRTFDVNKSKCQIEKLTGGILGGTIISGVLNVNDYIQISPGITEKKENSWIVTPIFTQVNSLSCETNYINYAIPGGLIGIGSNLDPYLCKSNLFIGQTVTFPMENPSISAKLIVKFKKYKKNKFKVKLCKNDSITISMGSNICEGKIIDIHDKKLTIILNKPICISENTISILSNAEDKIKMIGIGEIIEVFNVEKIIIPENMKYINPKRIYILENDIQIHSNYNLNYDDMLENIHGNKLKKIKIKLANPEISKFKNNKQLVISNFSEMMDSCQNQKDSIESDKLFIHLFEKEIGIKTSLNSKHQLTINDRVKPDMIKNGIFKTITRMKKCIVCGSGLSFLTKIDRITYINCETCKSRNSLM